MVRRKMQIFTIKYKMQTSALLATEDSMVSLLRVHSFRRSGHTSGRKRFVSASAAAHAVVFFSHFLGHFSDSQVDFPRRHY
jgi:hypothetical protein